MTLKQTDVNIAMATVLELARRSADVVLMEKFALEARESC